MKKFIVILMVLILLTLTGCSQDDNLGSKTDNLLKKNYNVSLIMDNYSKKDIKVDEGEVLFVDFTPSKINHIFNGWYTDIACTVPYDFSRPVTTNFNLYAGFVLSRKTIDFEDIQIKALSMSKDNMKIFPVSLVGFDYNYLEKNGMGLVFTIVYDVKYQKDYDVLWDIGYAGSPKYELSLANNSLEAYLEANLPTTQTKKRKSYSYVSPLYFSKDKQITLVFSTDNVQNIIYFSDISITIEATEVR